MAALSEPVRLIEPGVTVFSAAEIRIAVVPVGDVPEDVLASYASLVTAFRQVELANVRSFYKEAQKSPFKAFPWKTGTMHFHYVPQDAATEASPLAALAAHRKVLGVIGLYYCPSITDVGKAYAGFEKQCRSFPDAVTARCFAFEPSTAQSQQEQALQDKRAAPGLLMFPPGDAAVLAKHTEVMMHILAADLLVELERLMLTSSAASIDMSTFLDTAVEFQAAPGAASALEAVSRFYNDEELPKKRRYGRLEKAMGDFSLLAGSPADALDHYQTAADLGSRSSDFIWAGAALEGVAHAKDPRLATIKAQTAAESIASASSGGFGGGAFWSSLAAANIETEVRQHFADAKLQYRKRGALPLLVEADLKLGRLLAGLAGPHARGEVSALVSAMVEAGHSLTHPADRLAVVIEASQVMGAVGSARKRTLMLWQAVELSRAGDAPDTATLDIARNALEPPPDARAVAPADTVVKRRAPLASGVPRHWSLVRCGCIEGVLATAILAQQHSDVWDAAAMLLREHAAELPSGRQSSLLETLAAAASLMSPAQKIRPGPGPPPLVSFRRPLPPPPHLAPRTIDFRAPPGTAGETKGPFIFQAFAARREPAAAEGPVQWVAGETATVEVDISNPTTIPFKGAYQVERLTLEAVHAGDPALPPASPLHHTGSSRSSGGSGSAWKPNAVALWLPAGTKPTKVQLQGAPAQRGLYHLTGCRTTILAVTWSQPWSPQPPSLGERLHPRHSRGVSSSEEVGGSAAARVTVVRPLPLLTASLEAPDVAVVTPPSPTQQEDIAGKEAKPKREDIYAAPAAVTVRAARGQLLAWSLRLANRGRLPVTAAQVTVVIPETATRQPARHAAGVLAQVDEAALAASLPLPPGASLTVPLHLHHSQASAAAHTGEEELQLEVRVEYVSSAQGGASRPGSPAAATSSADSPQLGRRLSLPVRLLLQPSIQVSAANMLLEDSGTATSSSSGGDVVDRQPDGAGLSPSCGCGEQSSSSCFLEVDAISRVGHPVEVWLGRRQPVQAGGGLAAWHAWLRTAGDRGARLLPPGRAAWVHHTLSQPQDGLAGGTSLPTSVAAKVAEQMVVYWRQPNGNHSGSVGVVPIPPDLVTSAMSDAALALLAPQPASLSISLCRAVDGGEAATALQSVHWQTRGQGPDGRLQPARYALSAPVGQPLKLGLQLTNQGDMSVTVEASISCSSDTEADGEVASPRLNRPADAEASLLCAGAMSGVTVTAEAGASGTHEAGICFLVPGLYSLSAFDVVVCASDATASTPPPGISVHTLHVLAE